MFRFCTVFLAILVADLATSEKVGSTEIFSAPSRASKEEASELLQQQKQATKEAQDKAIAQISGYPEIISEAKYVALTNGSATIEMEGAVFVEALEEIKDYANSTGLDISQCLVGREEQVYELQTKGNFLLDECVDDMTAVANKIVRSCELQVHNMYKLVQNIERLFSFCADTDEACFNTIIDYLNTYDTPTYIENDSRDAAATTQHLLALILDCVNNSAYEIQDEGYNIIFGIQDCVRNLEN